MSLEKKKQEVKKPKPIKKKLVPKKEKLRASDLFMDGLTAEEVVTRMKNLDPANNPDDIDTVEIDETEAPF